MTTMPAESFSMVVGQAWTEVASGGSFGLQVLGSKSIGLYLGSGAPASDTDQFMIIQTGSDHSFSLDLDGANAYVKCLDDGTVRVRGWKV